MRPDTVRSLAEVCRRAGALEASDQLADRWFELSSGAGPSDPVQRLRAVFGAASCSAEGDAGRVTPQPYVRVVDFLAADAYQAVVCATRAALHRLAPAGVYDGTLTTVNAVRRRCAVRIEAEEMRGLILPQVRAFVAAQDVPRRLGLKAAPTGLCELQNSRHGDGDFFTAHVDTSAPSGPGRAISFVFYYTLTPGSFSGGDLLIYDLDEAQPQRTPGSYTRVPPDDNSLVFFGSGAAHEVEPVVSSFDRPDCGRFTLNGWIHW